MLTGRRVGELAGATGLTVRTLHYYEQIGLLAPSRRTSAGHRLYDDADVARLYRICLLRRLGLPLAEIGRSLDDPAWSLHAAMVAHLGELDRRLDAIGRLRTRLAGLVASAGAGSADRAGADAGRLSDHLLTTLEEMIMLDTAVQRRITLLVYADIATAHDWLVRVFGLAPGRVDRDATGKAVHGELHAGDGVIWMHQEHADWGLGSPQTVGASTASVAVMVEDVDAHYRHVLSEGGLVLHEPVDQDYGYREYSARDLEGHLWSFMKPLD
ncbi:MAG: MerR family transcriptional regulator [Micromonosporaceae bacterium]|nr:MerR family transcriptional regulator [Micromonosporaceae bacterium]